jgi:glyoxylase-like metal-dependent hydrolase (beta-lactamase superfamily II)
MADVNRITRLGMVNAYLVREDDGLTLIDTMLGGSAGKIIAGAEASGAPIVRILLTHAHADHIGSLDALKKRLPEAEVIISTRDARLLAKDMSLDPDEPKDKLRGGYPGAETKPNRSVEPGDRVGSLDVIAAPGHTPGLRVPETRFGPWERALAGSPGVHLSDTSILTPLYRRSSMPVEIRTLPAKS